jgi:hypothetical protein
MRRAISISLMMLFSWTLMVPFFAPDPEANLPACCRNNGKHHCMMRMMGQRSGHQKGFTRVAEKCPCCPASVCVAHSAIYKPKAAAAFYAEVVSHPACAPQSETASRICLLHSHQKRGPPAPLV